MEETYRKLLNKKVYHPEDAPGLKVHIYKEGQQITAAIWSKLVVPEDRLKALRDEKGKMWLGINARKHGDITGGLRQEGIEIYDKPTTRLQIEVNENGYVCNISTPIGYTYEQERAAQIILQMVPPQFIADEVIVSGSGFYKKVGSDVLTYWGYALPQVDENDPRFIEKGVDQDGNDFISVRIDSFPDELRMEKEL